MNFKQFAVWMAIQRNISFVSRDFLISKIQFEK